MAEVLNFPMERVRQSEGKQNGKLGEVLIFPGIRIERGEFSLSDRLPKSKRRRTRTAPVKCAGDERS